MLGCSIRRKEWIMVSGEIRVMARNKSTKKNNCRLDGIHWTSRCVDLVRGTRMTQYEIIEMAEQAGFDPHDMSSDFTCNLQNINAFAKLVAEKAIKEALAQPEQEPVAWRTFDGEGEYNYRTYEDNENYAEEWDKRNPKHKGWVEPLYTTPPQRKPLTDEQIAKIASTPAAVVGSYVHTFARAIESAHGIKGD